MGGSVELNAQDWSAIALSDQQQVNVLGAPDFFGVRMHGKT